MCVCMFQHISGTPGAISTKLGTHMTISIYTKIDVCVCAFACMFQHNYLSVNVTVSFRSLC
jgi:hypothetical protein